MVGESVVLVSDISGAAVMGQMTREEALAEARRRWGGNAVATDVLAMFASKQGYEVGVMIGNEKKELKWTDTYGRGDSWEAAFEDATRRESGSKGGS